MIRRFTFKKSNDIHVRTLGKIRWKIDAFQVAFTGATIVVVRDQMQPVGIYALFVGEQSFSRCTLCKKNLSFGGWVAVVVFLENWAVKSYC